MCGVCVVGVCVGVWWVYVCGGCVCGGGCLCLCVWFLCVVCVFMCVVVVCVVCVCGDECVCVFGVCVGCV